MNGSSSNNNNNNNGNSRGLRGGGSGRGTTPSLPSAHICCNRCERPLLTTLYLCSCFCVFCEECTVEHFQQDPNCPKCGRTLGEKDFIDLAISNPPINSESIKPLFQKIFTKRSSSSQFLQYSDMTSEILRQWNDLNSLTKFLLKQLVETSSKQDEDKGSLVRTIESLQQENIQLKQASSAATLELQTAIDGLQRQLQARDGAVRDLQRQLEEKENVIGKFRKLHSGLVMSGQTPPHSNGGGGGAVVGPATATAATTIPLSSHSYRPSMDQHPQQHVEKHQQQQPTPLHGYLANRAAEERTRQQLLQSQLHRGPNVAGSRAADNNFNSGGNEINRNNYQSSIPSGVTPIQIPRRPYNSTTNNNNSNSPGIPSVVIPGTPRIRDFSSSGYTFTSRAVPSKNTYQNRNSSHPLSPTMAFAARNESTRYSSNNNSQHFRAHQGFGR